MPRYAHHFYTSLIEIENISYNIILSCQISFYSAIDVTDIYGISLHFSLHSTHRKLFTSYFRSTFILSSYLVIPKGKVRRTGKKGNPVSKTGPSLLFSGGLQVCGEINIWFFGSDRMDGRTRPDRTVPTRRLIDRFENLGDHLEDLLEHLS